MQAALDEAAGRPVLAAAVKLVRLVHPALDEPLARTAKGGIVRRHVDALWRLARRDARREPRHRRRRQGRQRARRRRRPARVVVVDSMGLAALVGGAGGGGGECGGGPLLSPEEATLDFVTQHLKVVLLFAILLRHLQRFTVRTCHSWTKTPPQYAGVCIANNLLQTAAAEGLSYLSGVAIAGVELSSRQVAAPFVLIALFRWVFHPALEWVLLFQTDIGTAHLWFVLMVGLGRLYCAPIAALAPVGPVVLQCRVRDAAAAGAAALFLWRLTLAPLHINDIGAGEVRRELYHLLFGDKNYLQIVHNLPLFVGYATPPAALARSSAAGRARGALRPLVCPRPVRLRPLQVGVGDLDRRAARDGLHRVRAAARVGAFASALPDGHAASAGRSLSRTSRTTRASRWAPSSSARSCRRAPRSAGAPRRSTPPQRGSRLGARRRRVRLGGGGARALRRCLPRRRNSPSPAPPRRRRRRLRARLRAAVNGCASAPWCAASAATTACGRPRCSTIVGNFTPSARRSPLTLAAADEPKRAVQQPSAHAQHAGVPRESSRDSADWTGGPREVAA